MGGSAGRIGKSCKSYMDILFGPCGGGLFVNCHFLLGFQLYLLMGFDGFAMTEIISCHGHHGQLLVFDVSVSLLIFHADSCGQKKYLVYLHAMHPDTIVRNAYMDSIDVLCVCLTCVDCVVTSKVVCQCMLQIDWHCIARSDGKMAMHLCCFIHLVTFPEIQEITHTHVIQSCDALNVGQSFVKCFLLSL